MISLEAVVVMAVLLVAMVSVGTWLKADADRKDNQNAADNLNTVFQQALTWFNQNYTTVQAAANPTATYPWATFMGGTTTISQTNVYGQQYSLRFYKEPSGQIDLMVLTTGGSTIGEGDLRSIAKMIGGAGGFVSSLTPTNATGAMGGWNAVLSNFGGSPGGGHLAAAGFFQNASAVSNYLSRVVVPGNPQANQMETAIDMNNNNVNNANLISSQSLQVLSNGGYGAPSVTLANGKVIGFNQVPEGGVLGLVGANGQTIYLESLNGTLRLVNSAWNAQLFTVDQSGNVVANGNVTANGQLTTNSGNVNLNANGAAVLGAGQLEVNANGTLYLQPWSGGRTIVGGGGGSGQLEVTGGFYSDGDNYIYASAWPGSGCSQEASVRRDQSTLKGLVICAGGVWQKAGGGLSNVVQVDSGGWQPTAWASCPSGYTLTGGSCDINRGGDGREIAPRQCQPSGNSYYCAENNGGSCIAHAICAQ
ncbi:MULTISPECIES: shufflon system plasmid conjugative transfer pilus tip adhesin PilV [Burkholderia]|nr:MULTISPECIES: shufflon system plasmid conjugative transfer pilus tip adhesin PilV [Burkholderia cepacia complex]MBR8048839.1 shufflon system plasmid conjugative transfer pilus tip adhesin PilV [Burkholderia multivorans]MBY4672250.1 shufflon system plasmid conjugative transfer pilus tip adhesin PilV [Burkholderia multivorans]UXZ65274.1 shufflon system plasmid conjugative transfer pilus tip adhesin PilV [Burkholderia multivorans]HDR8910585.1 shufflon system plasmid conjugative transfer pilus t